MAKKIVRLDKDSFEQYFKALFPPLTYYAYRILKDYDLAKDIVHEAFTKLWENRRNIDTEGNVKSYLYRSVHNLSLNHIRDNKKLQSTEETLESDVDPVDFDYHVETAELEEAIITTINSMPQKTKEVFVLSRYQGLKYKEIAQRLGISVKTVEVHMSKALKLLRKNLKKFIDLQ